MDMIAGSSSAPEKQHMSTGWYDINLSLCKARYPSIRISRPVSSGPGQMKSTQSRNGLPTFVYVNEDGKRKYFHSSYDPETEAREWVVNAIPDGDSISVVLGGGFFYHVSELRGRLTHNQALVVVEADYGIFQEAARLLDLQDLLSNRNVYLYVGNNVSEAVKFISKVQIDHSLKKVSFAFHPPSLQTFPAFYQPVADAFKTTSKVNVVEQLRYKKFRHEEVRVLLLTTKYFLMGEIMSAMKRLGVGYRLTTISQDEIGREEFIESMIANIVAFKPDFVFTINHLGMDREGYLSQFLTKIEMPFASWYVDNPDLIISHYKKNVTPYCALFLWDKGSVPDMKKLGFEHVYYAPLGVDEKRFYPMKVDQNPLSHLTTGVSFVGNSMVKKVRERLARTKVSGRVHSHFQEIAQEYAQSSERHIEEFMRTAYPEVYYEFLALADETKANFKAALCWEATRVYRLERITRLLPFQPLIVGDSDWSEAINRHLFRYHPEVSYYDELPYLYNVTDLNFNATSRQMKGAVNQRVFDVPACGAFLLTDFQEQMENLFEVGKEVICYYEPGEIRDLAQYYLTHDGEREQIAQRGYERVAMDHTYVKRVKRMVERMKRTFA